VLLSVSYTPIYPPPINKSHPQLFPGMAELCPDRSHPHRQGIGNLLMPHAVDVVEDYDLLPSWGEPSECRSQPMTKGDFFLRLVGRIQEVFGQRVRRPDRSAPSEVARRVGDDAPEPRGELHRSIELAERPPGTEPGFLDRIVGVGMVIENRPGNDVGLPRVPADHIAKGMGITSSGFEYIRRVEVESLG